MFATTKRYASLYEISGCCARCCFAMTWYCFVCFPRCSFSCLTTGGGGGGIGDSVTREDPRRKSSAAAKLSNRNFTVIAGDCILEKNQSYINLETKYS